MLAKGMIQRVCNCSVPVWQIIPYSHSFTAVWFSFPCTSLIYSSSRWKTLSRIIVASIIIKCQVVTFVCIRNCNQLCGGAGPCHRSFAWWSCPVGRRQHLGSAVLREPCLLVPLGLPGWRLLRTPLLLPLPEWWKPSGSKLALNSKSLNQSD